MRQAPGEVRVALHLARHLGPRYAQAGVTLRFEVGSAFTFTCEAEWPNVDCTEQVREGVEGALLEHLGKLPAARVVLESVQWHEIDSFPKAFVRAARAAVVASLTA